ncbi:Z1 domain-containing protein [Nocardia sp. NPDC005978]|uniref:Z1 domain-containing protein n=1 Tax=Nocardia sp. NPDC005978 TaxID=3156725 RepID=UPI0033BD2A19
MSYQSPTWASALSATLTFFSSTRPRPLLPFLSSEAETTVTSEEMAEFIEKAKLNDPAHVQLREAVCDWDADSGFDFKDPEGNPTLKGSRARRLAVCMALGFDAQLSAAVEARMPFDAKPFTTVSARSDSDGGGPQHRRRSDYWDDYQRYLLTFKEWDPDAILSLRQSTREVISQFGDPTNKLPEQTKGLVVGRVQSGKTAHFTGVIARAIDAGYRLIIVLSGTVGILRAQTQRRLDMELIGVENILNRQNPENPRSYEGCDYRGDDDWEAGRFVSHDALLRKRNVPGIIRVTTYASDFKGSRSGVPTIRFNRAHKDLPLFDSENLFHSDAVVAVVKKRPAPLGDLIGDLVKSRDDLAELPVLIIDDEADEASIDTTPHAKRWTVGTDERIRTTTNQQITDLLRLCPRAKYVAYTATAFATVFIDRNDPEDLFPCDFILLLDPPKGYMGLEEFHDVDGKTAGDPQTVVNSNQLAHVHLPEGDQPLGRQELRRAIDSWVLSGAIKLFRRTKSSTTKSRNMLRHHTMLVHESTSKADHFATSCSVQTLWDASAFDSSTGIQRLRDLYHQDHAKVMQARSERFAIPNSFEELEPFIAEALTRMSEAKNLVLVVNSDEAVQDHKDELNFATDEVWRILVGGTQLSRGFTVEGLTVSYFTRKTKQGDTLMQAGRWFGFRKGYQDLVRLYIDRDLYEAFQARLCEEEAFRNRIRELRDVDEGGRVTYSPREVLIKVEQHLPRLKPTSPPKMRNATTVSDTSFSGFRDLYQVPQREARDANYANLCQVGIPLLAKATQETVLQYRTGSRDVKVKARVGTIDAVEFLQTLDKHRWREGYEAIGKVKNLLSDETAEGRITDWTVVWPQPQDYVGMLDFEELDVAAPIIYRGRRGAPRHDFPGSYRDHRHVAMPIATGEIGVLEDAPSPTRGVVLIYLVDDRLSSNPTSDSKKIGMLRPGLVIPLLSIALPGSTTRHRRFRTWAAPLEES